MDIEKEVRELMHKLNHGKRGVGKASSIEAWETKEVESPDGELLGMERVNERELALGSIGPASPCCDAPGDEHEPHCVMFGRGAEAHPWDA